MNLNIEKYRNEYLSLNLNDNINYEKFSMISIVYNSTKIEGCSLDENDTRILIENNITAKGKPLTTALNETEETNNPEIFRSFVASQQIKFFKAEIEKFRKKDEGFNVLF